MNAYFCDFIQKYRQYSEKLNIATVLINKTWAVFNDKGERQLFIFQNDGSVFITTNGVGCKCKWEWINTNSTLVINIEGTIYMLQPQYIDNIIVVFKLDGTNNYVFLTKEQNELLFKPKALTDIAGYFEGVEYSFQEEAKNARIEKIRSFDFIDFGIFFCIFTLWAYISKNIDMHIIDKYLNEMGHPQCEFLIFFVFVFNILSIYLFYILEKNSRIWLWKKFHSKDDKLIHYLKPF